MQQHPLNLPSDDVVEIFPAQPPGPPREDTLPVLRTMGYTLNISARFLFSALRGQGSIARGDELLHWWARKIFAGGNGALEAQGREHLTPGQAYVFMSNHRSLLDIPAGIAAAPCSVRMVMKQELLKVPVWGRAMVASGFIPVDRSNRDKAIAQLDNAKEKLNKGVSVWVFAEGTRSRGGELGPFKKGGFHIARQLGLPIVPVWISGTSDQLPPDTFRVRYHGRSRVRFGAPIPTTESGGEKELSALMDEVRARMLELGTQLPASAYSAPAPEASVERRFA